MKKISKNELLAILAAAGVSSTGAALATNLESGNSPSLGKSEQARPAYLADDSKSCGKGSCGKDEKGAAAAKGKHGKTKKDAKTDSADSAKKKSDK